jgi:hypothetical protein
MEHSATSATPARQKARHAPRRCSSLVIPWSLGLVSGTDALLARTLF